MHFSRTWWVLLKTWSFLHRPLQTKRFWLFFFQCFSPSWAHTGRRKRKILWFLSENNVDSVQTALRRFRQESCLDLRLKLACTHELAIIISPKKVLDKYNLTQSNNAADLNFKGPVLKLELLVFADKNYQMVSAVNKIYSSYIRKTSEQIIDVSLLLKIS